MTVPVKPTAPPPIDYAAIAKEMPTIEIVADKPAAPAVAAVEKPTEKPAEGEKPAAAEKEEPLGVGTPFEKGFSQLATKQAEFRREKDAAKHGLALAKVVNPVQAAALEKAMATGDGLAAINALGFSYADIASRVVGAPPEKKVEEKPAEGVKPEVNEDPEIKELKEERRQRKLAEQNSMIVNGIKGVVTSGGEKFKTIAALEDFEGVRSVIDGLWDQEAKSFVGGISGVEAIQVAAEEYERRLASGEVPLTKKQWEKLQNLTPGAAAGSTGSEATRERPGNAPVSSAKTLTNKGAAPVATPATPHSGPDYEAIAREMK